MKNNAHLFFILCLVLLSCGSGDEDPGPTDNETVAGCTDFVASNYNADATEDDCSCTYDGFSAIAASPATSERNALVEEFTGEWCGWCVDGTVIVDEILENNPGRAFAIAIHEGDYLERSYTRDLMQQFGVNSFPSGVVDREQSAVGRQLWAAKVNQGLEETAMVDIAIQTRIVNGELEGVFHIDFKQNLEGSAYRVLVYITESGLPAVAQQNYYNNLQGAENHSYFSQPAVLGADDYIHNHVLRQPAGQFPIAPKAIRGEGTFKRKFESDISTFDPENVEVIVMVTNNAGYTVMNVEGVKAGENVIW